MSTSGMCPIQSGEAGVSGPSPHAYIQEIRDMEDRMDTLLREFNQLYPSYPLARPASSNNAMIPRQMEEQNMKDPYVTDKDGNRKLQLQFDVRQFKEEEVQIKTNNRQLCVHARHEEKSEGNRVCREYKRYFQLPDNIEPERLSSVLSPEGVLTIEAPAPTVEVPKPKTDVNPDVNIPIAHT